MSQLSQACHAVPKTSVALLLCLFFTVCGTLSVGLAHLWHLIGWLKCLPRILEGPRQSWWNMARPDTRHWVWSSADDGWSLVQRARLDFIPTLTAWEEHEQRNGTLHCSMVSQSQVLIVRHKIVELEETWGGDSEVTGNRWSANSVHQRLECWSWWCGALFRSASSDDSETQKSSPSFQSVVDLEVGDGNGGARIYMW